MSEKLEADCQQQTCSSLCYHSEPCLIAGDGKCDVVAKLTKERDEARKERDLLREALQRFVNRLQYNSIYMDKGPTCATVNRNPVKEWDEDCIFAFTVLERLKGGAQ